MKTETKQSRHTCIVCGKKRYEDKMKIVVPHCHTGLAQWACSFYSWRWSYRGQGKCADNYDIPTAEKLS